MIDRDNFDEVMAKMTPGLQFRVANTLKGDGSELAVQHAVQLPRKTLNPAGLSSRSNP